MQGIVNEFNTPTVLFEQESMVEQIEHLAASVPSRPANVEYLPPMTIAHVNSEMIMAEMASETPKENPLAVKYTGPEITAQTAVPAAATSGRENSMHTSKGILSLSELKSLEVLRMEFASSAFKPKVILSYESISFNKACVKLLPGIRYVNVLIDRHKKRIIILPVNEHAKDALRWCGITRDGDVRKRLCTAKKFGEKLYEMMQWIKENKYRILAYYQEIEGVQLLVFNLRECEM